MNALSPQEKRAMLVRLLEQRRSVGPANTYQGALVLHQIIVPETAVNNMRSTMRLLYPVDQDDLRRRLQAVVERHPVLRTVYEYKDGVILQRVLANPPVAFDTVDVNDWTAAQVKQRLMVDVMRPFDVLNGPVFRARLYERRSGSILQTEVHHAACDLWSLEILLRDLHDPPSTPPPPSFIEYVMWEVAWLKSAAGRQAEAWWRQTLDGATPLSLPGTDPEAGAEQVPFMVGPFLLNRMREQARLQRLTIFTMVMSALQVLLMRLTGQSDVCVASPTANRPDAKFEQTVGFFTNPVTYRQQLGDKPSWETLWQRNRRYVGEALDHGTYPVVLVTPSMGATALPQTDVIFMFQQYQQARWVTEGLPELEPLGLRSAGVIRSPQGLQQILYVEQGTNVTPLMLEMVEQQNSLQAIFRYRTGCLSTARVKALVQDFLRLLSHAVSNPTSPV